MMDFTPAFSSITLAQQTPSSKMLSSQLTSRKQPSIFPHAKQYAACSLVDQLVDNSSPISKFRAVPTIVAGTQLTNGEAQPSPPQASILGKRTFQELQRARHCVTPTTRGPKSTMSSAIAPTHSTIEVVALSESQNRALKQARMVSHNEFQDDDQTHHTLDLGASERSPTQKRKRVIIIGLDFGTTYTSVCYYVFYLDEADNPIELGDIKTIGNWPKDHRGYLQVPSEIWLSREPKNRSRDTGNLEPTPELERIDSETDSDSEDEAQRGSFLQQDEPHFSTVQDSSFGGDEDNDDDDRGDVYWGFQCQAQRDFEHTSRSRQLHLSRMKELWSDAKYTEDDRQALIERVQGMVAKGLIRKHGELRDNVYDGIVDYLECVLLHTKEELTALGDYDSDDSDIDTEVRFAATVPVVFPKMSRTLYQWALEEACRNAHFGTLTGRGLDDLFFETEPKAAAAFMMKQSKDVIPGSVITILDCGGGTVDASTFCVSKQHPLTLGDPICEPTGDNCGAVYLNDNFRALLLEKLASERAYLELNGETVEELIDEQMFKWENNLKREKNFHAKDIARYKIPGLRASTKKGFRENIVELSTDDLEKIFLPLCNRVCRVLEGQLESAMKLGKRIQQIFLIGGFGASECLRDHLKEFLRGVQRRNTFLNGIELVLRPAKNREFVTAQAAGVVYLRQEPQVEKPKITELTLGFQAKVRWYQKNRRAHLWKDTNMCPHKNVRMVSVIDNFLWKGDTWNMSQEWGSLTRTHYFPLDDLDMFCEDVLWVSEAESGSTRYSLSHTSNKWARKAGNIIVDCTEFKHKQNERIPTRGDPYYEITYDLLYKLIGRNFRYAVRYPAGEEGVIREQTQICIASTFKPGTA